jgi:ABC-type lipoprotein release transport system permease subunit
MTLGLIFKRMRREWRSLAILLLAVCLLTAFFALGPFYIRAVTEVGLRFELDNAAPEERMINVIIDNEPLSPEALDVISDQLGGVVVDYHHYIRADYNPPQTQGGIDDGGLATGAFVYRYGEVVTNTSPRIARAYQPFAFADMPEVLDLVEGRWPVRLPPPTHVDPAGLSDAEQHARQIGPYTRGQVEVVITPAVAEGSGLELGSRLTLGTRLADGSGAVATVVVVGIVTPKDPDDPFWEGNRMFLEGVTVPVGLNATRWDHGLATIPEAYTDWLRPVTPGNSYIYQIKTNPDAINADNIREVTDKLNLLGSRLGAYHPSVTILTDLTGILEGYSGDVADTEGPIILLSGAILIMMLYHLINTVALVLEQQGPEWSAIVSRGGSIPQLVMLQFITVGALGLIGMVVGPLLSILFMQVMEHFGPLATALGGRPLGSTDIPRVSIYLSVAAGTAAVIVLTSPAFPAARRSLLRLKQLISRPPTQPTWARFALDFVLAAIGLGFLLRLYYLVGGDFSDLLNNIIAAPREVIEQIADNLTATGGLNDPFNLLGPALVLTGLALLWLRFFPWLMDMVSRLFQNSPFLTTPLAVWNVARDPSHYAQLVLLLIGTLALGTASLGLSATRDKGAWSIARDETGGSARVEINPAQLDPESVQWDDLPGVSEAASFMHAVGDPGTATQIRVHVFGVNPDEMAGAFPEWQEAVKPLNDIQTPPTPGLELPDDAARLSAQVYSLPQARPEDPAVSVILSAYLQDSLGVPFYVPLELPQVAAITGSGESSATAGPAPTPTGTWLTFDGPMPQGGRAPYYLMRVGINSVEGNIDAFEHSFYLDLIATQDVFGTSTPLESFETETNLWKEATVANPYAASWAAVDSANRVAGVTVSRVSGEVGEIDGPAALRLDYRMGRLGGRQREPSFVVNEPTIGRIPIVINRAFARQFTGRGTYRTAADAPLTVGDAKNIVLNVGVGSVEIGYQVVGVIDDIPSVSEKDPVMITHIDLIKPVINQAAATNYFFTDNEIWLELPDREPSAALKEEIADLGDGMNNVTYAWTRYGEIQREPLPSAVAGMLFAGFWISLLLSLLDFAFYLVVTAKQRLFTFAVLRSLGWNAGHIWRLLFIEQIALITPALIIGSLIGAGLAYLLLPFLALVGGETLKLPWLQLGGLLLTLVVSFTILMGVAAIFLRRMSVNQVLRLGEE